MSQASTVFGLSRAKVPRVIPRCAFWPDESSGHGCWPLACGAPVKTWNCSRVAGGAGKTEGPCMVKEC
eukprot:11155953-Lingulodinium_polyedra.AAC.1